MGAWGTGPFQNDAAGDFALTVADGGLPVIEDAFDHVLEAGGEYLEAPSAEEAIAAAAIVARLKDGVPLAEENDIEAWIAREQPLVSDTLIAKGRDALSRVMTEPSELLELWQETDDFPAFQACINALLRRLN